MGKRKKSAREKLQKAAEIVDIPPKMEKRFGKGKMLIPSPLEIEELIRMVPKGKLITQGQIRQILADKYGVKTTCPLTTGIFVRLVAEAAEEDREAGKSEITPYWRVIKDDGSLNPKFPRGIEWLVEMLKSEGHQIVYGRGKKPPKVANFENALVQLHQIKLKSQ